MARYVAPVKKKHLTWRDHPLLGLVVRNQGLNRFTNPPKELGLWGTASIEGRFIHGGPMRSPHYWDVRRPKISGSEAQKTLVFDPQWLDIQNTIGGFAGAKMPSMYPWDSKHHG